MHEGEYVLVSSHRGARVLRAAVKVIPELVNGEAFAGACVVSERLQVRDRQT